MTNEEIRALDPIDLREEIGRCLHAVPLLAHMLGHDNFKGTISNYLHPKAQETPIARAAILFVQEFVGSLMDEEGAPAFIERWYGAGADRFVKASTDLLAKALE